MLVSVIVPHYNRHDLLWRCLNALRQQGFADFEIVLIDDGSTDPTPSELQSLFSAWSRLRRLALPDNRGRAAARNAGLAWARGELVIFLDADMDVGPDFVAEHWRFHLARGSGWLGQGRIIGTQDPAARPAPSLWTDASCARFATGNVSVAREILLRLGGFDEAFGGYGFEDLELGYRLMRAGWRSALVPAAISWHFEPVSEACDWARDLERERMRGQGAALFYHKHPSFEVRLIAQLTPLHTMLDLLPRAGGLIGDETWRDWIQALQPRHPKLALALYRGLLNRYCRAATLATLNTLSEGHEGSIKG